MIKPIEKLIYKMLKENTGIAMLDSGGYNLTDNDGVAIPLKGDGKDVIELSIAD